jgi:RNA recognition motif-containing protein
MPVKLQLDDELIASMYKDGKSSPEIAEEFGVSAGTIRNRIRDVLGSCRSSRDVQVGRSTSQETRQKLSDVNKGKNNPNWRGGLFCRNGYVRIYSPDHPNTDATNNVYEHRLVMEEHLGRYLTIEEIVHHSDGNKSNNVIENLILFSSNSEHTAYHNRLRAQNGEQPEPSTPEISLDLPPRIWYATYTLNKDGVV